ncbi:hypothetical protein PSTG_03822 [Puccinia striiformis f. sp. tritici PST-78]|uniref:No apical meristem-associated C-terminal domain-containing protein n=1 Tax=Puccinia striiformis f. sp. tritici PST-78 TaxID=1165861 RepID=A0A0L0VV38_9BASI|nr:hypothetical protein PSTG_03822 [Puccinia striiformis f. sp. tritici PST-78]
MASTTNSDITSSPTIKRNHKRKSTSKAVDLPIEVDTVDDEPVTQPAKKSRKQTKAKAQTETPVPAIDEPGNEDDEEVKTPVGSRLGNYSTVEDIQICRSWLETTEDPLNSTNQSGTTFWDRVRSHYVANLPTSNRTADSIKCRWGLVQRATNKFYGCVKQITYAKQSGVNGTDNLASAFKLYAATNKGQEYGHIQCYRVLAPAQKWRDYCEKLEQKRLADLKKLNPLSDITALDPASDTTVVPPTRSAESVWPTGNKAAMEAWAQEIKDSKWKDELVKVHRDLANQSQAQTNILDEQKRAIISLADSAVMKIDLDSVPEAQREFFEWEQEKVREKMAKAKAEARRRKEEEEKKKEEDEKKKKEEDEKKKREEEEKKAREELEPIEIEEGAKKKKKVTKKLAPKAKQNPAGTKKIPSKKQLTEAKKKAEEAKKAAEEAKKAAEEAKKAAEEAKKAAEEAEKRAEEVRKKAEEEEIESEEEEKESEDKEEHNNSIEIQFGEVEEEVEINM